MTGDFTSAREGASGDVGETNVMIIGQGLVGARCAAQCAGTRTSTTPDAALAVRPTGPWYGIGKTRALLDLDEVPCRTPAKPARQGVHVLFGEP